ncbi:MAG: DNA-directed RNA polymerase subunit omega [Bacteroidales bacterium]|jgi:DNA-directed RNA polymerase subunit K/omega
MDYKKVKADLTTITRNTKDFGKSSDNFYETVVIISKRANQIASELKEELNSKLEEFSSTTDNLEEIFENREQIEISRFYEHLPKPASIAIREFADGKIYHRNPNNEKEKE